MPRWHPVSISGYHIREAGSTAAAGAGLHPRPTASPTSSWPWQAGLRRRRVRAPAQLLLQRPHRLLRGDRQVPGRPAHLGPLDAGALRRHQDAQLDAAAVPHPDRRRVAHRAAARGQHRPHRHRGAGRRARAAPRACTPTPWTRRWPCPTEKAARIALRTQQVHRPRDRRGQRGRPARRLVVRRGADRRDRAPGRGDLRPPRRARRRLDARGRHTPASRTAGSRARSPTPPTSFERKLNDGRRIVVGVNRFTEGNDDDAARPPADHRRARGTARSSGSTRSRPTATTTRSPRRSPASRAEAADPERQPHAGADRRGARPTPPSARSWTRWPTSSAATSRRPPSDPASGRRSAGRLDRVAHEQGQVPSTRACRPPARGPIGAGDAGRVPVGARRRGRGDGAHAPRLGTIEPRQRRLLPAGPRRPAGRRHRGRVVRQARRGRLDG